MIIPEYSAYLMQCDIKKPPEIGGFSYFLEVPLHTDIG